MPNFKIYKEGGVIYYRQNVDNKEIKFSTGVKNIAKAKIVANRELKKRLERFTSKVRSTIGFEMEIYLEQREKEVLSPNTHKNIRNAIRDLKPYWNNRVPQEITSEEWLEYCEWHKKKYGTQLDNVSNTSKHFVGGFISPERVVGLVFYIFLS